MIIISVIDYLLFVMLTVSCLYLFVFVLFSLKTKTKIYLRADKQLRYLILFPAYKEDKVIEKSINEFFKQTYPSEKYLITVISDQMQDETNNRLRQMPVRLLEVNFEQSTKAKALNFAMNQLDCSTFDAVIVIDGDNLVTPDFLEQVNNAYVAVGKKAFQAHRVAKNTNTTVSMLDAVSEEINNSIFRKGFANAGLSATLSGSGMIFEIDWFKENVSELTSSGEDKELEALLLKQKNQIEYLEDVYIYDEKIQKTGAFYQQRRRWLAAQYGTLSKCLKDFPDALRAKNYDYCNKLVQWMMLPRIMLIGLIGLLSILWSVFNFYYSIKWWGLLLFLGLTLILAIPRNLCNKKLLKAVWQIPVLFVLMFINFFRMKGAYNKFIHTDHKENVAKS